MKKSAADDAGPRVHVCRAELTLARDDRWPLREVPFAPDPLTPIVQAFGNLNPELAEAAEVCVDLLPLRWVEQQRRRRRIEAGDKGSGPAGGRGLEGLWAGLNNTDAGRRGGQAVYQRKDPYAVGTFGARQVTRDVAGRVYSWEPAFAIQVLVVTRSTDQRRARNHMLALVAAFGLWSGQNSFRRVGVHLGPVFLGGANFPGRRAWFDFRLEHCRFAPAKRRVVTTVDVGGFLKPPTAQCDAPNVVRSGGLVPASPRDLPTYERQPELMPLGWVATEGGERLVGVALADTYFSACFGRSRFGKSEGAIVRFVSLARAGHGCLFFDPHADALARIKPYLTDLGDRVVEVNLSPRGRGARQAGWNLFSMEGRTEEDIEGRVAAVVESFSSTLRWGEINNRAITITTMAAQSLCELALILPPDLAPTLFQMTTLLSSEAWRAEVVPYLAPSTQEYWRDRFDLLSADAVTPVTNLLDRLRSSATVAALFGSSRSTYDIRRCMDEGKIVLACPAGSGDKDRLVSNFVVYDMLQALLSRMDVGLEARLPFHAWIDELPVIDGSTRGNLAVMLEQTGKFGGRLHVMAQQPTRVSPLTLDALLTNRSHLITTTVGSDSAALLAAEFGRKGKQWAVDPSTITQLPKYHFVGSVTHKGRITTPFRFRGLEVSELWGDHYHPERVAELDRTVDANMGRRPVGQVLAELDGLNERIVEYLKGLPPRTGGRPRDRSGSGAPGLALVRAGR
ncbi:MAG: hypothetical protein QOK39_497 [Acidimicrobiaceae bacterium]|jgi:hypothetical protein|nr:hypothetical protein [Acidimicrobiaceae bacterium]